MQITGETILADILKQKGAEEILAKHNLPCLTCPAAAFEIGSLKLGEVCQMYGIKVEKLLEELNNLRR